MTTEARRTRRNFSKRQCCLAALAFQALLRALRASVANVRDSVFTRPKVNSRACETSLAADFIAASGAALGALPLVRSIDALAQVTNPVFRHGVASGDPLADRVILWTRVTPKRRRGAQTRVVADGARSEVGAGRGARRGGDRRGARLHGEGRRDRPRARRPPTTTASSRGRALGDRPHADACRARASRACASAWCRARTCRRATSTPTRASPTAPISTRSCTLATTSTSTRTSSTATARQFGRVPMPEQGDGGAAGLPRAPRAVQGRSRFAGDPPPASVHRDLGRSRVHQQHLARRRAEPQPTQAKASGSPRRAAAIQAYFEWMPIREDAQTLQDAHLSHVPLRRSRHAVHARHAADRPRSAGAARGHRDDRVAHPAAAGRRAGRLARGAVRRRRCATSRRGTCSASR